MSNVVACYKWVLDEETIRVRDDLSVDRSKASRKIGNYDRNAIEAAATVAGQLGGKAFGLTFGDKTAKKSVKEALARGLDELVRIDAGDEAPQDAATTAAALAQGVRKIGDVSLVICADGSSDQFNRQTAPRIAHELGWPVVTAVSSIVPVDGGFRFTRVLEDALEEVEVAGPAVAAVLPEVAELHIPTLKQIMAAGKKPQEEVSAASLELPADAQVNVESETGYENHRRNVVLDAADENCIADLVAALRKEGVI